MRAAALQYISPRRVYDVRRLSFNVVWRAHMRAHIILLVGWSFRNIKGDSRRDGKISPWQIIGAGAVQSRLDFFPKRNLQNTDVEHVNI